MSRRRGEFEHRTSIFEGAFRAWSYLGGLDPVELESKSLAELDPLNSTAEQRAQEDPRLEAAEYKKQKADNVKLAKKEGDESIATRRLYPYEPLPRSGLAHPFVQAILSPWLGPEAEQNAIQLGLTTLRTWWQHRRKGESGSAVQALGTDKMRGVVEGYTRHFFSLAYCLVTNDGEQSPRTLATKMKELEKVRQKKHKRKKPEEEAGKLAALALNADIATNLSPSQRAKSRQDGGDDEDSDDLPGIGENSSSLVPGIINVGGNTALEERFALKQTQIKPMNTQREDIPKSLQPAFDMKGKCIPGKLDLQQLALQVKAHGTQAMHMGGTHSSAAKPEIAGSSIIGGDSAVETEAFSGKTPIVFVSPSTGDIQIAMSVDGITCAHCVKIVETVLKGCNGNKSPIEGLLDAAADHDLCSVIIKIDKSSNAKRIARESARNLAMVGYTAKVMEMSIDLNKNRRGNGQKIDFGLLNSAFDVVAATNQGEVFDWTLPCTCPDNGVLRKNCRRHLQMNDKIFQAFREREKQVMQYMVGCGARYGGDCTCDPDNCQCIGCKGSCKNKKKCDTANVSSTVKTNHAGKRQKGSATDEDVLEEETDNHGHGREDEFAIIEPDHVSMNGPDHNEGGMNMTSDEVNRQLTAAAFDAFEPERALGEGLHALPNEGTMLNSHAVLNTASVHSADGGVGNGRGTNPGGSHLSIVGSRRQSNINHGFPAVSDGRLKQPEQSERTFGRAMSGLSALSIDWDNMEDFDVNVDHSSHINNVDAHHQAHHQHAKQHQQQQQQLEVQRLQAQQMAQMQLQTRMQSSHRNSLQSVFPYFDENESEFLNSGVMAHCAMAHGGTCDCGPQCVCVGCPIHMQGTGTGMKVPQQRLDQGGHGGFDTSLAGFEGFGMMGQMNSANSAAFAAMQQRLSLHSAGNMNDHQLRGNNLN